MSESVATYSVATYSVATYSVATVSIRTVSTQRRFRLDICCALCLTYTLRSKGAKWHLLGFFGLSLYWHPQMVLQRTLLEGSFERTLLRTLMWGSLKEP